MKSCYVLVFQFTPVLLSCLSIPESCQSGHKPSLSTFHSPVCHLWDPEVDASWCHSQPAHKQVRLQEPEGDSKISKQHTRAVNTYVNNNSNTVHSKVYGSRTRDSSSGYRAPQGESRTPYMKVCAAKTRNGINSNITQQSFSPFTRTNAPHIPENCISKKPRLNIIPNKFR